MSARISEYRRSSRAVTAALVDELKAVGQDFEWYPTTESMLSVVKNDMETRCSKEPSVLDCGAGDGRALLYLTEGKRYAIEKSQRLLKAMSRDIYIVGTEFSEQTLIDKRAEVIFCNMPYRCYASWAVKIIREGNCSHVYLVMPKRWRSNRCIKDALAKRKATTEILGSFDFSAADRAARAKVDIVHVRTGWNCDRSDGRPKVDPFDLWFESEFSLQIRNTSTSKFTWKDEIDKLQAQGAKNEIVKGRDIVSVLEELYQKQLAKLMENYKSIEALDPSLLIELDVNIKGVKEGLKAKAEGMKDCFWQELFNNMSAITSRLTVSSRERMLGKLTEYTHVDFSASNCRAVLIWAIKNANSYYDDQLIALFERMTEEANVRLYKSNQRVLSREEWRYNGTPRNLERYFLEYRVVLHRIGGLSVSPYEHDRRKHNGLDKRAFEFLSDVVTVARNLGFSGDGCSELAALDWTERGAKEIHYYDIQTGTTAVLMKVRAFQNQNLHIHLDSRFITRLNIEFGRLKGWLKNAREASDELGIEIDEASGGFGVNAKVKALNSLKELVVLVDGD